MKTFYITPTVINESRYDKDDRHPLTLPESYYGSRYVVAKLFDWPYSIYSYGYLFFKKTGLDCISRDNNGEYLTPAFSEAVSQDIQTGEIRKESFPSVLGGKRRQWNTDSEGLCVMLPGLNANPIMYYTMCNAILEEIPKVDFYTPYITDLDENDEQNWNPDNLMVRNLNRSKHSSVTGIYNIEDPVPTTVQISEFRAERHAVIIMETIRLYLTDPSNHPKKVVLVGFSKGTQIQTFVDWHIKNEFPYCHVLFISLGGIFRGTNFVSQLDWYGLGFLAGKEEQVEEMKLDSKLSKEILDRLKFGGNINHDYHFFASKADEYVTPFTSSLPILPVTVKHHVFNSASHTGIYFKSIPFIVETMFKFFGKSKPQFL